MKSSFITRWQRHARAWPVPGVLGVDGSIRRMSTLTTHGALTVYTDDLAITILAPDDLIVIPADDWRAATAAGPQVPAQWEVGESGGYTVWTISRLPEWVEMTGPIPAPEGIQRQVVQPLNLDF